MFFKILISLLSLTSFAYAGSPSVDACKIFENLKDDLFVHISDAFEAYGNTTWQLIDAYADANSTQSLEELSKELQNIIDSRFNYTELLEGPVGLPYFEKLVSHLPGVTVLDAVNYYLGSAPASPLLECFDIKEISDLYKEILEECEEYKEIYTGESFENIEK
ncbi:hypothetical protein PVAND_014501 [Polypedilum vanderplanki]|uniref:Secreted protein n=1 Tax=Polypedilum vanderplanki TaxID=319348 RepID=A0A9J6B9U2_POLVA|nr:hypothetical protein PVAND_014501 [Polypedilum vanderplanki]